VLLRTNILNNLPEGTQDNNLSASLTQTSIDAPALTLGTPATATLSKGQAVYYKVTVPAGETLQVFLGSQTAAEGNELDVSYGTMRTRVNYDYRFSRPLEPNQRVTVPETQDGVYYVLAYADSLPGASETCTLTAALVPFSVQAVSPGVAGTGPVT